jgi:hypothetical protein
MTKAAESAPNVALVGSYTLNEKKVVHSGLPYTCHVVPGQQMLRRYLAEDLTVFGSPTCVMYRTSDIIARKHFFDLESPLEDIEVCFDILQKGDFAFVHQVLTFTRRENESTWSQIAGYNPLLLCSLVLTYRYGPTLFAPADYNELLNRIELAYHRFLGHAAFEGHSKAFWAFHAQGLATVGQRIQRLRLARYILWALVDLLGNPKGTLGRLFRTYRWQNRQTASP